MEIIALTHCHKYQIHFIIYFEYKSFWKQLSHASPDSWTPNFLKITYPSKNKRSENENQKASIQWEPTYSLLNVNFDNTV